MSSRTGPLAEGWYLMSTEDLERELARHRDPRRDLPPSNAERLEVHEALRYRDAGNLPDDHGRTLRLVLHVSGAKDVGALSVKRLEFEPDFHDAPTWRREGSKPVNIVPLRVSAHDEPLEERAWWDEPEMAALEEEWSRSGTAAGITVPAEYRSFVFKTIVSLRAAGREVTPGSIRDSIARWLSPEEADEVGRSLGA